MVYKGQPSSSDSTKKKKKPRRIRKPRECFVLSDVVFVTIGNHRSDHFIKGRREKIFICPSSLRRRTKTKTSTMEGYKRMAFLAFFGLFFLVSKSNAIKWKDCGSKLATIKSISKLLYHKKIFTILSSS